MGTRPNFLFPLSKSSILLVYLLLAAIASFLFILETSSFSQPLNIQNTSYWKDHPSPIGRRANATILILGKLISLSNLSQRVLNSHIARNSELEGVVKSVKQLEDRWNKKFHYPYVLLNDEPFDATFKRRVMDLTNSKVEFGLIPQPDWIQPDWIDEKVAAESRRRLEQKGVPYAASVSYRNMCRFNSGFFFRHRLVQKYQYYWRVEPDVTYFCDIDYDPFLLMQDQDKLYGFTIALTDFQATIPTLWKSTKEFTSRYPELVSPDNAMDFLSDNGGLGYNACHFWSNFEIANMDLWRSEAYTKYFDFLDKKGGFYYERWGDAPVHSIAVSLFARKDQIHYFSDIGYKHDYFMNCPRGEQHRRGKCWCDQNSDMFRNKDGVYPVRSCMARYEDLFR